jgi:hypothetical protein
MKNLKRNKFALLTLAVVMIALFVFPHPSFALCAAAIPIGVSPLLWSAGQDNPGGFKQRVLFVPDSMVSAAPALPAEITVDADYVTAAGAFVFSDGTSTPKYIYCTKDTVKYGADNQGDDDAQSFTQKGEFFFPGNLKEAAAFARYVNNTPGYLVLEAKGGEQIMVGQKGMLCYIKPAVDLGQKTADRRGYKFTFEADSFVPTIFLGTPIDMDALSVVAP